MNERGRVLDELVSDGSLETMMLARAFDAAAMRAYRAGEMPGLVHSYAGQEGVAAGVLGLLDERDRVSSHHRGHAHAIALGVDPRRMMAELYAKREGTNRGLGGSMHIASLEHGLIGANGIVGGGVGLAVGAGMGLRARGEGGIAVGIFGDGAVNSGVVAESLNLASVWGLPVLFICEDNAYGEYTPRDRVTGGGLPARLSSFGMTCTPVDGMDAVAVRVAARGAVDRIRAGGGPEILHALCYRYDGHHVAELDGKYRSSTEVEDWRERDPISRLVSQAIAAGVLGDEQVSELEHRVAEVIEESLAFARAGLPTEWSDLADLADVYAGLGDAR